MRRLVEFRADVSYYAPELICIKVVDDDEWDLLRRLSESPYPTLSLGEVSGKHSEVFLDVDASDFIVKENPNRINMFLELFPKGFVGNFDVFEYIKYHLEEMEEGSEG